MSDSTEVQDLLEDLLHDADEAWEDGDLDACETACREVLAKVGPLDAIDPDLAKSCRMEALLLLGDVLDQHGETEQALATFDQALAMEPGAAEALLGKARIHFDAWRFEEAEALLGEVAPDTDPQVLGPVRRLQGLLREFAGVPHEAAPRHAEAARLDPEGCPLPVTIPDEEAFALLDDIVNSMPDDIVEALENVVFDVVGLPDASIDKAAGEPPTVLGLYSGDPVGEREFSQQVFPNTIRIFKRNLELMGLADQDELREQLQITILHEIGHHLGWDEDDLEARGLA